MVSDHDIDETVCSCLSLVIYYDHFEKVRAIRSLMSAEIHAVAHRARKLGIQDQAVLPRLDAELAHRFDDATRHRLHAEFAKSYRRPDDLLPSLVVR
jgi:hypothetical protein